MAISDDQIAQLRKMCPLAGQVDLGTLIRAAEGGLVANAIAGGAAGLSLLGKKVTLGGANPTHVQFSGADDAATLLGSLAEAFALTVGNTFIINPNGEGELTWTIAGTAGVSTGDTGCSEDMTAETDTKLRIKVDDAADWSEVTCDWAGCVSGALIAAQMQTKIRALGGVYASVTVVFSTDHYVITSADFGTGSLVNITESLTLSCTEELKIGNNFGASEAAGTGDAALLSKATAAECAVKIAALSLTLNAVDESGNIRLTSTTTGTGSKLLIGDGTENAVLGFTNAQTDTGDAGFGLGKDMANDTYQVLLTMVSDAPETPKGVSVYNLTTAGFDIYCETSTSTIDVQILVLGALAS